MLIADAECGRRERYLLVHAGGRPLPVKRHMRSSDKRRDHKVWRSVLDLGDGRTKIRDIEREEISFEHGPLALIDIVGDPFRGDLAVIVVGGNGVDFTAPLLHCIIDDRFDGLSRCRACDDTVSITYPALVEHVIEIKMVSAA